jgi:DNA-binding PadR family transcriptional regulator
MTRLIILSLLKHSPMHGYEIRQFIKRQKMEQWSDILSGSIYFALNQMKKEGLVEACADERTGNRLRRVYTITAKGKSLLNELVRGALVNPPHSLKSSFSFAIGMAFFSNLLEPKERVSLITRNIRQLEETLKFWKEGQKVKAGLHPAMEIILRYDLELIDRDILLLRELLKLARKPGFAPFGLMPVSRTAHKRRLVSLPAKKRK